MSDDETTVPDKINVCVCGEPLIFTFIFAHKEFYCLGCGRAFEFYGPESVETTPDLWERQRQLQREFAEIAKDLVVPGSRHSDCDRCKRGEDHEDHATEEELAASFRARARLRERAGIS